MPLVKTRKASAFGDPDNVYVLLRTKLIYEYLVSDFDFRIAGIQPHFAEETGGDCASTLEMTLHCLGHALRRGDLDQPDLHCLVSILGGSLALNHNARPGLQNRRRQGVSALRKDLRHAQLFT